MKLQQSIDTWGGNNCTERLGTEGVVGRREVGLHLSHSVGWKLYFIFSPGYGVVGRREVGWGLIDVDSRWLSGLKYKLVCCFKLAVDMVGGGIREFVYDKERQTFLESGGIWYGQVLVDQSSRMYRWMDAHSNVSRASDQFLQCKKLYI